MTQVIIKKVSTDIVLASGAVRSGRAWKIVGMGTKTHTMPIGTSIADLVELITNNCGSDVDILEQHY